MRQLSPDNIKLLEQVGKNYPQLGKLLSEMRLAEMEQMAAGSTEFFPVQKGRIGMLTDLLKHVMTPTP